MAKLKIGAELIEFDHILMQSAGYTKTGRQRYRCKNCGWCSARQAKNWGSLDYPYPRDCPECEITSKEWYWQNRIAAVMNVQLYRATVSLDQSQIEHIVLKTLNKKEYQPQ